MTGPTPRALLAIPGDLDTPTGGYEYARRLLDAARPEGLMLEHWPLPGGFPDPDADALAAAELRLQAAPAGWPLLIDGLALGALPAEMLDRLTAPVIALCHHPLALESGLPPDRADALRRSEIAALARAAHVITTSRTTAATLVAEFAVPEARITVAPPGTDPARPARGPAGGPVRLLSVGSLTPRKGHDVLVAALARLDDLDWRLTVHGAADLDPAFAKALGARIDRSGLADRIALAGPADRATLAAAREAADLFVLASRHEGFGMAYAEAMAHGLATVGCDTGAVAEATAGAACLVPPDEPEALAAALRPLIADPAARARLAARCHAAAAGFPRWPDTAATVARAVAAVMDRARA